MLIYYLFLVFLSLACVQEHKRCKFQNHRQKRLDLQQLPL